jgi:hypothetical protein
MPPGAYIDYCCYCCYCCYSMKKLLVKEDAGIMSNTYTLHAYTDMYIYIYINNTLYTAELR